MVINHTPQVRVSMGKKAISAQHDYYRYCGLLSYCAAVGRGEKHKLLGNIQTRLPAG